MTGVCHACGHDGHTATLLAAAKILKEKETEFSGRIKLFFQQGEEVCGGAKRFVAAGLMDDVDRVYSTHVSPRIDAGKISLTAGPANAGSDVFKIKVIGKSAHVATPGSGHRRSLYRFSDSRGIAVRGGEKCVALRYCSRGRR